MTPEMDPALPYKLLMLPTTAFTAYTVAYMPTYISVWF